VVIWKSCTAGAGSTQGVGFIAGWWTHLSQPSWCLSQHGALVVPHGVGAQHGQKVWEPEGWGLFVPCVIETQQGLKGSGLRAGVRHCLGDEDPGGHETGSGLWHGTTEGRVSHHGVDLTPRS
jgi:hypothetical protein